MIILRTQMRRQYLELERHKVSDMVVVVVTLLQLMEGGMEVMEARMG